MTHQAFGKREMTEFVLKVLGIKELIIQRLSDCAVLARWHVWLKTEEKLFNFTTVLAVRTKKLNPQLRRLKQNWTKQTRKYCISTQSTRTYLKLS